MDIVINNLEPEIIEKLKTRAKTHGRSLMDEIKLILIDKAFKDITETRYNAWGKPVTPGSITEAVEGMRRLQKTVALAKSSILQMKEQGRRF